MTGLIISRATEVSRYASHLLHHPSFTMQLVNTFKGISTHDFILIEYRGENQEEIIKIAERSDGAVLIYRNFNELEQVFNIPSSLYDFSFDDHFEISDLHKIIQILINRPAPRKLKGILLPQESFYAHITQQHAFRYFGLTGFELIHTTDLETAQQYVTNAPLDFILIHCHTKYGSFTTIRQFSEHIRSNIPGCIIIITCCSHQMDYYDERHGIRSFQQDKLVDTNITFHEIVTHVIEEKFKKAIPLK